MTLLQDMLRPGHAGRHAIVAGVVVFGLVMVLYGLIPFGDGVGIVALFAVLLVVGAVITKNGDAALGRILLSGFFLRAWGAIVGNYYWPLPESGLDAVVFEREAARMATELGPLGIVATVITDQLQGPELYSAFIGFFYAIVGVRSFLLGSALNVLFGALVVYNVWRVAGMLWGPKAAKYAGWIAALHPTLALFSSIMLREAPIHWLLSLAVLNLVEWRRTRHPWRMVAAFAALSGAAMVHGAMVVAFIGVLAMLLLSAYTRIRDPIAMMRERAGAVLQAAVLIVSIIILFSTGVTSNKLTISGTDDPLDVAEVSRRQLYASRGGAGYLPTLQPETTTDLVWQAPIRAVFLVGTPFIWQVRESRHLLGLLDAALGGWLVYLVVTNRRVVWKVWEARALLITYVSLVLVYGLGASNFGTASRHRTKFVLLLIILAAAQWSTQEFRRQRRDHEPERSPADVLVR